MLDVECVDELAQVIVELKVAAICCFKCCFEPFLYGQRTKTNLFFQVAWSWRAKEGYQETSLPKPELDDGRT